MTKKLSFKVAKRFLTGTKNGIHEEMFGKTLNISAFCRS